MNYGMLKPFDIADGPGVRVSLFVSGCRNECEGCFNRQTWDFAYGEPFTEETEREILNDLKPYYINGFTLLGGEPFEPENQAVLSGFLGQIRKTYPEKDIWCYTGYTYEKDLRPGGEKYTQWTDAMLDAIDVLVDGRFVLALKDISLQYRGSSNQRILDLRKMRESGTDQIIRKEL